MFILSHPPILIIFTKGTDTWKMIVIGLCGGSGAGKTTATETMRSRGAAVIDTDRVYREICTCGSDCLNELADAFGDRILTSEGELDRAILASIIYADSEARQTLNSITHKHIKAETVRRIEQYQKDGYPAVIVDAPLLFESGFDTLCDCTVGIIANEKIRIERIVARDGIDGDHAMKRIRAQHTEEFLRGRCEYILENNGEIASLKRDAGELYDSLIKLKRR